ncbi:MAG: type I glyceraldehyde-3-phosphate dehydrogenase [Planctomycetota bacterium]
MTIRIAINGFGRIGRLVFRIAAEDKNIEIVHINDLFPAQTLAHLLKYDSAHGRFAHKVSLDGDTLNTLHHKVGISAIKNINELPWKDKGVDVVIESTGVFRSRAKLVPHMEAGAKRVLLTVPADDEIDATLVFGVNENDLKAEHRIVSNASCTTNCVAQLAKVMHDTFGIQSALMTTIHAYTNDQQVADVGHKDLRRSRAAAQNIIPTTTGAAKTVGKVITALKGKIDGMAFRVPVLCGSVTDLTLNTEKDVTKESINAAFKAAAAKLPRVLEYTEDPIVSSDIVHNENSCIFDAAATQVLGNRMAKIVGWYDNEWGYSSRVVDLIRKMGALA